jgi:hypothetical protein
VTGALAEIGTYEIRVAGPLDSDWSDWLVDLTMLIEGEPPAVVTTLTARVDQAALRGLMTRIWDFNYPLLSVDRLDVE